MLPRTECHGCAICALQSMRHAVLMDSSNNGRCPAATRLMATPLCGACCWAGRAPAPAQSSPASGMPSGRSLYARHSISLTVAHSGVICGPLSTPNFSATLPLLYSSGCRGPTEHCRHKGWGPTRVSARRRQQAAAGGTGADHQAICAATHAKPEGRSLRQVCRGPRRRGGSVAWRTTWQRAASPAAPRPPSAPSHPPTPPLPGSTGRPARPCAVARAARAASRSRRGQACCPPQSSPGPCP